MKHRMAQTEQKLNIRQQKERQSNEDNLDTLLRDVKKKDKEGRNQMITIKKDFTEEQSLLKQSIAAVRHSSERNYDLL